MSNQKVLAAIPVDAMTWHDEGLCSQTDPDAFYPEIGSDGSTARKVCMKCPVQLKCLESALEIEDDWGIWGGLTPKERRKFKKRNLTVNQENVDAVLKRFADRKKERTAARRKW